LGVERGIDTGRSVRGRAGVVMSVWWGRGAFVIQCKEKFL